MLYLRTDEEYYMVDSLPPKSKGLPDKVMHHLWSGYNGYWDIKIELIEKPFMSPLHIGVGELELAEDNSGYYQPFARIENRPTLSGSGIKGAVRSYTEALSHSCEGGACRGNELCPACQMFGGINRTGISYLGRFSFSDAYFEEGENMEVISFPLRWGGRLQDGRRFYWHCDYRAYTAVKTAENEKIEVLLPPAHIKTRFFFQNAMEEELGLILLSMGMAPGLEFPLKLGGGKNRGLGSVWFKLANQFLLKDVKDSYYTYDSKQDSVDVNKLQPYVDKYLAAFDNTDKEIINNNLAAFNIKNALRKKEDVTKGFEEKMEKNRAAAQRGFKK